MMRRWIVLTLLLSPVLVGRTQAGGLPEVSQQQTYKQQWVADTVKTAQEQDIPKGELLKQLVLSIAEEIGFGKALIWLATLPVLMLAGTVFGVLKVMKRK